MTSVGSQTNTFTQHANLELLEGQWIGHLVDLPGCFASSMDRDACVAGVSGAIMAHRHWLRVRGVPVDEGEITVEIDEVVRGWLAEPDNEVNAFFATDRVPLSQGDIDEALQLLSWTRADLLAAVAEFSEEALARDIQDSWSINRILLHIGGAEWWYLDWIGLAFPRDGVPDDPFTRLTRVRTQLIETLPTLAGDDRLAAPGMEVWSARKLLRRALWHERDHTNHIRRFRERLERGDGFT